MSHRQHVGFGDTVYPSWKSSRSRAWPLLKKTFYPVRSRNMNITVDLRALHRLTLPDCANNGTPSLCQIYPANAGFELTCWSPACGAHPGTRFSTHIRLPVRRRSPRYVAKRGINFVREYVILVPGTYAALRRCVPTVRHATYLSVYTIDRCNCV